MVKGGYLNVGTKGLQDGNISLWVVKIVVMETRWNQTNEISIICYHSAQAAPGNTI